MFEVEQHYLSDCMAEAGFDYTPLRDPRQVSTERPNYFDSTFVKTYGFGIVKSRDDLTILDEETVNDQLFASLSSEAQLSYSNAMSGTDGVSGCQRDRRRRRKNRTRRRFRVQLVRGSVEPDWLRRAGARCNCDLEHLCGSRRLRVLELVVPRRRLVD